MIKSKKKLKEFLGYRFEYLESLLPDINNFYGEKELPKLDEYGNARLDVDGKPLMRKVNPSHGELKLIQGKIKKLLNRIQLPNYIHGGIKRKSNITYAEIHLGKKFHFCTDIKDFFPSITYSQVYQMLLNNGCTPDIAHLLTRLTTYKTILPQGTPTSTHIANLISLPVDHTINEYCLKHNIFYGRFVDDLAFSSMLPFNEHIEGILSIIRKAGFRINYKKTFAKIGKITNAGVDIANNTLDVSAKTMRKIENPNTPEKSLRTLEGYRRRVKNRGKRNTTVR